MKDMPILTNVQLVKIDKDTKELIKADFSFGIYEDAECTKLIKEVKSDKEAGTVLFEDLRYSTAYIKELVAPKGYQLSDKILKLEINNEGVFIDGNELTEENNIYSFEFENTLIDTPKTGDNSKFILWASILGMSLLTITVVAVRKYKKDKNN